MISWKEWLEKKKVLIADGGWGTELIKQGLKPGEIPEVWNVDRPEGVRAVAASYVKAGADIILTNTFGGNPLKLAKMGLGHRTAEINRLGAEISREAARGHCLVFGSIGPTGEFMTPLGTATETGVVSCFEEQAKALLVGGVDGIVVETMTDLAEAKAALRAVRENTSLPVVVSMTFDKKRSGYVTLMGVRPGQAASELEKAGADIVGANCGAGIDQMIGVAQLMRQSTPLPIWCKPNAGLPEFIDGNTVYRETPEEMASRLRAIVEAGASIVGGCCGTSPAHIQAFVLERNKLIAPG
ncbi:MAG TPA: homocysteine S-methyltransferase family protein [Thermodesulfobacteriota bacterium]|nr:homocysteine S-methyltransferase family protein [Thermodesulfobacteriota bacterium]